MQPQHPLHRDRYEPIGLIDDKQWIELLGECVVGGSSRVCGWSAFAVRAVFGTGVGARFGRFAAWSGRFVSFCAAGVGLPCVGLEFARSFGGAAPGGEHRASIRAQAR